MPPDAHANAPRDNARPQPANQVATSRVALHPLRGATPVTWRCTRTERVQCPRIGCNTRGSGVMPTDRVQCLRIGCTALPDKNDRGTWTRNAKEGVLSAPTPNPRLDKPIKRRHHAGRCTRCGVLHPVRGAAPVAWRCTRTERVQCPRIGCNVHGSGVPRSQTRTTAEPGIPQHERQRPQHPCAKPGTWQPVGFEYVWMG